MTDTQTGGVSRRDGYGSSLIMATATAAITGVALWYALNEDTGVVWAGYAGVTGLFSLMLTVEASNSWRRIHSAPPPQPVAEIKPTPPMPPTLLTLPAPFTPESKGKHQNGNDQHGDNAKPSGGRPRGTAKGWLHRRRGE